MILPASLVMVKRAIREFRPHLVVVNKVSWSSVSLLAYREPITLCDWG